MIFTGPFHLDVFCDHTMALGAHQGHFPSPKHLLQEEHVQFILTASVDMWTSVDLDAPFEQSLKCVCITVYKAFFSSAFCAATSCSPVQPLMCAQT